MSAWLDALHQHAARQGHVRLVDGATVRLVRLQRTGKRGAWTRARVQYTGRKHPGSHERTISLADIVELVPCA